MLLDLPWVVDIIQPVKKFPAFLEPRCSSACYWSFSWASSVCFISQTISLRCIFILSSYLYLSLQSGLVPSVFQSYYTQVNSVNSSLLSPTAYIKCYFATGYHIGKIIQGISESITYFRYQNILQITISDWPNLLCLFSFSHINNCGWWK
jgi:hypothetical protein